MSSDGDREPGMSQNLVPNQRLIIVETFSRVPAHWTQASNRKQLECFTPQSHLHIYHAFLTSPFSLPDVNLWMTTIPSKYLAVCFSSSHWMISKGKRTLKNCTDSWNQDRENQQALADSQRMENMTWYVQVWLVKSFVPDGRPCKLTPYWMPAFSFSKNGPYPCPPEHLHFHTTELNWGVIEPCLDLCYYDG